MKKNILLYTLVMVLILLLAGCGCRHEWSAATCTAPKTCSLCGETEGGSLPHTWEEATCTDPKTCTVCKTVEGNALGHTWQDANCTVPKICSVCQATEGEAAGHKWEEATTEEPKTCSVCKQTSGSKLETDPRFTTNSTKVLQGTWHSDVTISDEMMGLENFGGFDCRMTLKFGNTGEFTTSIELKDEKGFMEKLRTYTIDTLYATFAAQGLSKELADQTMLDVYGLSIPDYVDASLENFDMNDYFAAFNTQEVYYVEGNSVFTAINWNATFGSNTFTITDDTLVIDGLAMEEGGQAIVWTKA